MVILDVDVFTIVVLEIMTWSNIQFYEFASQTTIHTPKSHFIQNPENRLDRFSGFFYFAS